MAYEVGQTIVWGLKVYDTAGTLADLGGGNPTATVTKPDTTTASATVAKDSTGTYRATIAGAAAGRWKVVWAGSGSNSGGLPYTDNADVVDYARLIIPLSTARAALNVPSGTTVNDAELRDYIAAATIVVESIAGPQLVASRTELHDGNGRAAIALHQHASSVTTVADDGTTLAATDWCVGAGDILYRGAKPGYGLWAPGARNVSVTYAVGGTIAPNVTLGASHLVAHWWRQTQQAGRPMLGMAPPESTGYATVAGYAVPNFVVDLLTPSDNRTAGMA